MKLIFRWILHVIVFSAIVILALKWNHELVKNIFFTIGIISSYVITVLLRAKKKTKKKGIPSYIG